MKKKPVVGITPYCHEESRERYMPEGYVRGLTETGCEIRVIDYLDFDLAKLPELAQELDGMLFSGGPDVESTRFGQEDWPEVTYHLPERDELELRLFDLLYPTGVPIFGICRGAQLINVAMGGSLVQHVPKIYGNVHQQTGDNPFWHRVRLVPGTRTERIFGVSDLMTDSYHHQAAGRVGKGLVISAWAEDGVVEALEQPGDRFLLALQWHPEKTLGQDEFSIMPFRAFREAIDRFTEKEGRT